MSKTKISYYLSCLLLVCHLFSSCQKEDDGKITYTAEAKTAVGNKLVKNTDLIATVFSDSSYTVTEGLTATELFYFSVKGFATRLFIFEVDLANPKISMEVSTPNNSSVAGLQRMTLQATHKDAVGHMVWGGVNGSFFLANGTPHGLLYKNGSLIQQTSTAYPNFFMITKDNKARIADAASYSGLASTIQEAVGGGEMLVKNKVIVTPVEAVPSINPRTCIGVSADQTKVYIMAVDGRQYHYSNGMTYEELSKCMIALGAENALNLDGGGSTSFFVRKTPDFSPGRFQLRNTPSENGGEERAVANGLLIISK